jgi:hypothetical protein
MMLQQCHNDATTIPQRFHNDSTAIQQNDTFSLSELWLNTFFRFIIPAGRLARQPVWNHVESSTLIGILIRDSTMIPHRLAWFSDQFHNGRRAQANLGQAGVQPAR